MIDFSDLDGFTLEDDKEYAERQIALLLRANQFDPEMLRAETAVRAVWLLVKREMWEELAVIGIKRSQVEPKIRRLGHYHELLTNSQYKYIRRKFPEFLAAGRLLQEVYKEGIRNEAGTMW